MKIGNRWAVLPAMVVVGLVAMAPARPALAQADRMAGIGLSDTITARVKVQSVDAATRALTLVGPAGNALSLVAGPEVINFDQIKAGDTVLVRYHESVAFVLSPPGTTPPAASLTVTEKGAAKGQMPAGSVGARLSVTGLVVAIDPSGHTLQMVDPSGGSVRPVQVRSKEGLRNFRHIKVGDTITAIISQAIAVSVQPAT